MEDREKDKQKLNNINANSLGGAQGWASGSDLSAQLSSKCHKLACAKICSCPMDALTVQIGGSFDKHDGQRGLNLRIIPWLRGGEFKEPN